MNYHIMVQDKFLDSFIEDVIEIGQEDKNVFWFRGQKPNHSKIKVNCTIEYIGDNPLDISKKLEKLNPCDNIFVHWYDLWIGQMLLNLPNKIFVVHWGGEFFEEPFWYHSQWLFDKKTAKVVKKNNGYPLFKLRKNVYKMLFDYPKKLISFKKDIVKLYKEKNAQVKRIDYVLTFEKNKSDLLKTKKLYPDFEATHLPFFYDVNFDLALNMPNQSRGTNQKDIHLLIGNSATPANNHLDAFDKLKKRKNIKVYCPLSYGQSKYKKIVIEKGIKYFGDNFIPIVDFKSNEEYVELINRMDVLLMYHNRSQAWGNISIGLTLGKPVFLKPNNSLNGFIESLAVKTYDANYIDSIDLMQAIKEANDARESNNQKLKKEISKERRLQHLSNIFSKYN